MTNSSILNSLVMLIDNACDRKCPILGKFGSATKIFLFQAKSWYLD